MSTKQAETMRSTLADNDFWVLGVTVRDSFARVIEAANDPLLSSDPERAERARICLTNPKARIDAEVSWLPGVAPGRARQLVEALGDDRLEPHEVDGLPALARTNVLVAALETRDVRGASTLADTILKILEAANTIEAAQVLSGLNEDRAVARIPIIRTEADLVDALERQMGRHVDAIVERLDAAPTDQLIEAMTHLVEQALAQDLGTSSEILQALVAAYESRALEFLQSEAATIRGLAEAMLRNGAKGEAHLAPAVKRLGQLIAGWDEVAQPIQLMRQALGDGHGMSRDLAHDIRSTAVDLNNDHGLSGAAAAITEILAIHFREISELRHKFDEDAVALEDIRTSGMRSAEPAEPPYVATIGLLRSPLRLEGDHLNWSGETYKLSAVDRVRWGGTRHSVNGIPTGTTYTISIGAGGRRAHIETRSKDVFQNVTRRLWRACAVRISIAMMETLRAGKMVRVGGISCTDTQVALMKDRFLSSPDVKMFPWSDVMAWSDSGEFFVASKSEPKFRAKASFQNDDNTHMLSNLCEMALSKRIYCLSKVLDS